MRILLLSGVSGAGKTRIGIELCKDPRFYFIKSFTDRPRRPGATNNDHEYISKIFMKFMLSYDVVASTTINGYHYCSTFRQFDPKKINVYVVDKKGIDDVSQSFEDAQIFSVLVVRDNINIGQSRKNRNIIIPDMEEVDFVLENNVNVMKVVDDLKQKALLYFGE